MAEERAVVEAASLLHRLGMGWLPMCARHRAMAAGVVVLAASRAQRCEDGRYVLLARGHRR